MKAAFKQILAAIVDYFDLQSARRQPKLGDRFRK